MLVKESARNQAAKRPSGIISKRHLQCLDVLTALLGPSASAPASGLTSTAIAATATVCHILPPLRNRSPSILLSLHLRRPKPSNFQINIPLNAFSPRAMVLCTPSGRRDKRKCGTTSTRSPLSKRTRFSHRTVCLCKVSNITNRTPTRGSKINPGKL